MMGPPIVNGDAAARRKTAEDFGDLLPGMIAGLGGQKSTGYAVAAAWWQAIENGKFG